MSRFRSAGRAGSAVMLFCVLASHAVAHIISLGCMFGYASSAPPPLCLVYNCIMRCLRLLTE